MGLVSTLTSWLPLPSRSEEKRARRALENHLGQLEMELRRRVESVVANDRFVQPWERQWDGRRLVYPSGFPRDRTYGRNLPILADEHDLRVIRSFSRLLCETNLVALGFRDHIVNFVVGKGYDWEVVLRGQKTGPVSAGLDRDGDGEPDVDPDVQACQQVLDEFKRINGWGDSGDTLVEPDNDGSDRSPKINRERETYERAMEDGEVFLRLFRGGMDTNGVASCRFVEPECVKTPPDETLLDSWGWGILTDEDDIETRLGYYIEKPETDNVYGEKIPASRMLHLKLNTKSSQKRGLPDFFPLQDEASGVRTLIRNMTEVSGILSAIAYIREHAPYTTGDQVNRMIDRSSSGTGVYPIMAGAVNNPGDDRTRSLNLHEAGTIIDVSNQLRYTPGPINSGIPGFVQASQATLRMIGLRWGCPEYFSGDASNANFASTLVSGGPFERSAGARQQGYAMFQSQLAARVLWLAVESGRLRREQVQRVTIRVTTPPVVISNRTEDTNRRRTLFDAKVLSPQTWALQEELDPAVEAANWKAWNEQFPDETQGGLGMPGMGGMDGGGDDDGGLMAGLFGESADGLVYITEDVYSLLSEADRSHLVKKVITNKKGNKQTVYVRRDGGGDADGKKPNKRDIATANRKKALDRLANHIKNPSKTEWNDLGTIATDLNNLRVEDLKALARTLQQKVGGRKAQLVDRILSELSTGEIGKGAKDERPDNPGSGRSGSEAPSDGGGLETQVERPADEPADQGWKDERQPNGAKPVRDVPASIERVNTKIDRYSQLFRSRGQHQIGDWLEQLRNHINTVGVNAAMESIGVASGDSKKDVYYQGAWDKDAFEDNDPGRYMAAFCEQYLSRTGIGLAHDASYAEQEFPVISSASPLQGWGRRDGNDNPSDFFPLDPKIKDKLGEAQKLPGLEKSEDINKVMGRTVTHLTPDVLSKLDEEYGKGTWIVKAYGDDAAAGYGIFFPQRAEQIRRDAQNTIWNAGSAIAQYGFSIARNSNGEAVGLEHKDGQVYMFGSRKYKSTIDGDVRMWGDRVEAAAANEQGAELPGGGKEFMVQPAFRAVGVSDADRAAGKTIAPGEGRVHITTRNGKAEIVPHATWIKGEHLPVVFENEETKAMAQAAVDAINALPESERQGQIYAPDIIKAEGGYRVVEANPANATGSSGYLGNNPMIIDSYVSHLTGKVPAHVAFIRKLLTERPKGS